MFLTFILPALMGWVGGIVAAYIPNPFEDNPPIDPPWPILRIAAGIVGGVLGALLVENYAGTDELAVIALISLAGGAILTDLGKSIKVIR